VPSLNVRENVESLVTRCPTSLKFGDGPMEQYGQNDWRVGRARVAMHCIATATVSSWLSCLNLLRLVTSAGLSSWGALCQTQMGAPVFCHSLFPIPAVSLTVTASRLKWGLVPIDIRITGALILTI